MPDPKPLDERLEIEAIRAAAQGDADGAREALKQAEELRTAAADNVAHEQP